MRAGGLAKGWPMEIARFRRLLDAHGADIARWPQAERAAACRLLATSPEARRLQGDAANLDRILEGARGGVAPESVARVVGKVSGALPAQAIPAARTLRGGPVVSAALFGALVVLGFVAGIAEPDAAGDLIHQVLDGYVLGGLGL